MFAIVSKTPPHPWKGLQKLVEGQGLLFVAIHSEIMTKASNVAIFIKGPFVEGFSPIENLSLVPSYKLPFPKAQGARP